MVLPRLFSYLLGSALLAAPIAAHAGDYPDHPIRLVTGAAAGGGSDFMARLIAAKLTEKLGQTVLVENRPGAGQTIAADYVAHAQPDGYTIFLGGATMTIPVAFKLNYDAVKSFAPITLIAEQDTLILANPSLPVNSLQDLVDLAKANPGKLNFGDGGAGTPPFMLWQLLMSVTGIKLTHIPYPASGPAQVAMMGNEVQLVVGATTADYDLVKAGKEKALAVGINTRSPKLPDVPTVEEALHIKDFDVPGWYGLMAPAGTPKAVIDKLHDAVVAFVRSPDGVKTMADQSFIPIADTPEEFSAYMEKDAAKWQNLIKTMNISLK